ncbi:Prominin-1-A [Liparis tanakae]|uniref:Prominin-1-A n=1 Tax=Liparis tanakae TaxID=230148 RepID=A0A4Z2F718_9TELE|nr:Prominin-1-A [Liparis tanakae]
MWKTGVPVLLSVLLASGELQQETESRRLPPPGKLDFGYVPAGVYETLAHYEPGPIGILFHMVHAFLCVVQPNAFPKGKRALEHRDFWKNILIAKCSYKYIMCDEV